MIMAGSAANLRVNAECIDQTEIAIALLALDHRRREIKSLKPLQRIPGICDPNVGTVRTDNSALSFSLSLSLVFAFSLGNATNRFKRLRSGAAQIREVD